MSYEDSSVIGLSHPDGRVIVNPPMDTVIQEGDEVIAISKDDDTIKLSGRSSFDISEDLLHRQTSGSGC